MVWLRIIFAALGLLLALAGYAQNIPALLIVGIVLLAISGLALLIIDFHVVSYLRR